MLVVQPKQHDPSASVSLPVRWGWREVPGLNNLKPLAHSKKKKKKNQKKKPYNNFYVPSTLNHEHERQIRSTEKTTSFHLFSSLSLSNDLSEERRKVLGSLFRF